MTSVAELEPRPISVGEYHRMIEAGIIGEDERLELLEGVIVAVSPQKRQHAYAIQRLARLLSQTLGAEYAVLPQLPLTLGELSEPEPDLAVTLAADAASAEDHPCNALLVIEVSAESLRKDRLVKGPVYAKAGIPEYWIVNLVDRCVEVRLDPERTLGVYTTVSTVRAGDELRSTAVPEIRLAVADLFS